MALTYNEVLDMFQQLKDDNFAKIEKLNSIISSMKRVTYTSETKYEINAVANELLRTHSGGHRHMISKSLKRDLPSTIIKVCLFDINSLNHSNHKIDVSIEEYKEKYVEKEKRKKAMELAEKILPYRDDYIRDFSSIDEGVRQWDCLFALVEDGDVLEENLSDYGLDLIPKE